MRSARLLVGGLMAATVYYAVFGGEYSVFELRATRSDIAATREELADVEAHIDSLRAWADSLERDSATIERVAREDFGLIREGEMLYRFVEEDSSEARPGGRSR